MPAIYVGDTSKGQLTWGAVNLKDALPAEAQSFLDAFVLVNNGVKAAYAYQMANAYLSDAETVGNSAIAQLKVLKGILNTVIDIVASLFDTGFFELLIPAQKGGLGTFTTTVSAHVVDRNDPNRPTDDGGAMFMSVMLLFTAKDLTEANKRINGLGALWDKTKKDALAIKGFIERTVEEQAEIDRRKEADKKDFFKHYYRKVIIGSHKQQQLTEVWHKQTLADLMPKDFVLGFQRWLSAWEDSYEFDANLYKLSDAVDKFWKDVLAFVEDMQVIVDAYVRAFTDTQLTFIVSPPIVGEALVAGQVKALDQHIFDSLVPPVASYSGTKSATQVYIEFLHELQGAIQASAKDLTTVGYSLGLEKNMQEKMFGGGSVSGFPAVADSEVVVNAVARTVAVTAVTGISKFSYYVKGQRYETDSVSVAVPSVSADSHFFVWFDEAGALQLSNVAGTGTPVADLLVTTAGAITATDVRVQAPEISTAEALHIEQNYTEFLRDDYCVGGIVFLFKSASYKVLQQQVNSLLRVFGVQAQWPAITDKFPS